MLGIFYMILCILTGKELAERFLFRLSQEKNGYKKVNFCWVFWPAALLSGTLVITWMTYGVSYFAETVLGKEHPLLYGNLIVTVLALCWLGVLYWRKQKNRKQQKETRERTRRICSRELFEREVLFFVLLLVFLTWIMFYVFHMKGGILYSGFTVFGDYAPHTAMMRSFSLGNNFPTQYPHFGGADIKYHFMYQFLVGNLEYLGIRIDFAYNLLSAVFLLGFLMMLYGLAVRLTGKCAAGIAAVFLFFFRSGLAFFQFAAEHVKSGDFWTVLQENTSFIGYTPNENWGLWNFNVYLNQRHLALGMVMVCTAVWIYLDWLEAGVGHPERGVRFLGGRLFSKEAWVPRNAAQALAVGILMGLCAFWNGAAVIGGLLILLGFAAFSDGKLDYALTALAAVILTLLQTRFFIKESAMSFSFYWGFLAEDKSFLGVVWYLLQMSGLFFLGFAFLALFLKRRQRAVLFGFLLPVAFAFCISLTPDINVNHKYVMIAYAFAAIFWADALVRIWKRGWAGKAGAVLLCLSLTVTGVYDFVVILKGNDEGHRTSVKTESNLTDWLAENLDSSDLILTPEYSMNEVTMSGAMMYCGWPYYAWSAGYDTYYRAAVATEIYTTQDGARVKELVEQEGITYILFEEGMTFEQKEGREDVIAQVYPLVYTSDDGRIRIYET